MRRMMGLLGVCGTASLLLGLWETAIQGEPIVADGMLLKNGAMLLYAVIWVAVALLFFVKERRQKAKCNEE